MADGEVYSLQWRFEGIPLDLAAVRLDGLAQATKHAGYVAYFREETGFGTVYFSRAAEEDE